MKTDRTNIETSHKNRHIFVISRLHTASLIPRAQECTASHGADHFSVFFIHTGNIALSAHGQPVRIHGLGRAGNTGLKYILCFASRIMDILIKQKYDFREQNRFFMTCFSLTFPMYIEKGNSDHLLKSSRTQTKRHSHKRIISAGRAYRVEFILNSLPALITVSADFLPGIRQCFFFSSFP